MATNKELADLIFPDVKKTVKVSKYAFDNNFPTDAEKNEVTNLVTKTKGWKLITE